MTRVAVIGSGTWGTAVASLLGGKGHEVSLWAHSPEVAARINAEHRNPKHLSDIELPRTHATSSLGDAVSGVDAIVMVVPSAYLRQTAQDMAPHVSERTPVVVLSKGVEAETGYTMLGVLRDVLGHKERLACLAGPNHAEEVSRQMFAATVVASSNETCAEYFQDLFMAPTFRVYTSRDVIGVELCAAAKNVIAIANGMCVSMGLGDNASAALITRGLAEITRLVVALGGDSRTCQGLAGMGDLIATCTSPHSRNRSLGELLVQGGTLEEYEAKTHMVAEGAVACKTVTDLARKHHVEMPISELVRQVLWEGADPHDAAEMLFNRPKKSETE